jgi:gliding motility-associated-like protein
MLQIRNVRVSLKSKRIHSFRLALISMFLCFSLSINAQGPADNWYFGTGAGLSFTGGAPVSLVGGMISSAEGVSSLSDAAGNLLFYTDGVTVFASNHSAMPNGTGLLGGNSSSQSAVAMPKPGSTNLYYLFTADQDAEPDGIRYSLIDMTLNSGLGDIVAGQKNILLLAPATEKLSAVKHCNNLDNWIVAHDWNSNQFYSWLLSSSGVSSSPVISAVGATHDQSVIGCMKIAPNGSKLALSVYDQGGQHFLQVFDFNSSTGQVSNPITINLNGNAYGVEFSPNSQYVYFTSANSQASATISISQIDLCAGSITNIISSETIVGSTSDGFIRTLQLGPNGKLYFTRFGQSWLGEIPNPNIGAPGCGFQPNGVSLGAGICRAGLPNFNQSFFEVVNEFSANSACLDASFSCQAILDNATCLNPISNVSWDFGEPLSGVNNSSNLVSPNHTYSVAGNYNVRLIVNYPCGADTIFKTVNAQCGLQVTIPDHTICSGACASLQATVSGGVAPYTWSWTGVSSSISGPINVCPTNTTTYSATVTDFNGLTATATTTVSVNPLPNGSVSLTPVTCNGLSNGGASVTVTGAGAPYTYLWNSTPSQTGNTLSNVAAGLYNVTITNALNCQKTLPANVIQPPVLSHTMHVINSACGQANGSATVIPTGGNAPYTYVWNTNPIQSTPTASNLAIGNYHVDVTDAKGCIESADVQIANLPSITAQISLMQGVTCPGQANATLRATPLVGTAPYSFLWSNGETTQIAVALAEGPCSVTITDASNCPVTFDYVVPTYSGFNFQIQTTTLDCGQQYAAAQVTIGSGYTYSQIFWDSSVTPGGLINSSLLAGAHTVTVISQAGCSFTQSFQISQSVNNVGVSISITQPIICNASTSGALLATPIGGTSPYTYAWSNGSGQSGISGLSGGNYSVVVTDATGCSASSSINFSAPDGIDILPTILPANCSLNGGEINIEVSGGFAPYVANWSDGQSGFQVTGLQVGNLTVTIIDSIGCQKSTVFAVPGGVAPSTNVAVSTPTSCASVADGYIYLAAFGTTGPYTALWPDSNTSFIRSDLAAGAYNVLVTDGVGCSSIANITVVPGPSLSGAFVYQEDLCGTSNGSATIQVSGGFSPYSYAWTTGDATQSITSQPTGPVSIVVTDNNSCQETFNGFIPSGLASAPVISVSSSISCHDSSDATIQVISPLTPQVIWLDGPTSVIRSDVGAGTYTAFVSQGFGCSDTVSVTVPNPPSMVASITTNDATCSASDGSAQISYSGGTGMLTHIWMNGSVSTSINNLPFGAISAIVSDVNGCELTENSQIGTISPLQIDTVIIVSPSCAGGINGAATIQVSGNSGAIIYLWSDGTSGSSMNGLSAGNYSVTITDASGCSALRTFQVQDPSLINVQISTVDALCFEAANGQATISVSGGSSPYVVTWPNGQTASTRADLNAGTYLILVQDNLGCQVNENVLINQPDSISASITSLPSTCGAASGSATVLVQGGTLPYFYMWSNSSITNQANSLAPGTANVLVTDANGCQHNFSTQIQSATSTSVQIQTNNTVSCFGGADAELEITSSSPVTILWNDGNTQSLRTSLAAGNYTAITTDAGGCRDTLTVQLSQPSVLNSSFSVTPATCTSANGNATVIAAGGTAPYTYLWTNGSTTSTLSNVVSGQVSVEITDSKSCLLSVDTVIPSVNPLVIDQITTQDASCFGFSDGAASAMISGATGAVSYTWSSGSISPNAIDLSAGNYSLSISDGAGCLKTSSFIIDEPSGLQASILTEDASCFGFEDAQASVFANGGTMPYSYTWNGIVGADINNNLAVGDHVLVVSDFNNCSIQHTVSVGQPNELVIMIDVQPAQCGLANGNMEANVIGGTMPYQFAWSSGESNSGLSNLLPGTYTVSVTDANGCISDLTKSFTDVGPPTIQVLSNTNVSCYNGNDGAIEVEVNGGTGALVTNWNTGVDGLILNNLNIGTYTATVSDALGCSGSISHSVTQPLELQSNLQSNNVLCYGGSSGNIVTHITGGTPDYSTSIVALGSTIPQLAVSLNANIYAVSISDANGCQLIDTVEIFQPEPLAIAFSTSDVHCFGGADGTASAEVSGGTLPYQYLWSSGELTNEIDSVQIGTYILTVTDSNQCVKTDEVLIDQPDVLQITISGPNEICAGEPVNFNMFGTGGFGDYAVEWMTGQTTDAISFISDSTIAISVELRDENNCVANRTRNLLVHQLPIITLTPMNATSCAGECVQVQSSFVEGGIYTWTTGIGSKSSGRMVSFCFEHEGIVDLNLQVTDNHGCSSSASFENYFTINPLPAASFSASETNVPLLDALIYFTNTSQDAVSSFWNFDDRIVGEESTESSASYHFLEIGSYPVTLKVVNEYGCSDETTRWVQITKDFAVYLPNAFSPNADGLNDGFKPLGIGYESKNYSFSIFDRWGNNIFSTNDPAQAWDGSYQKNDSHSSQLSNDVFIWKLQLEDFRGLTHDYSGSVTLVR